MQLQVLPAPLLPGRGVPLADEFLARAAAAAHAKRTGGDIPAQLTAPATDAAAGAALLGAAATGDVHRLRQLLGLHLPSSSTGGGSSSSSSNSAAPLAGTASISSAAVSAAVHDGDHGATPLHLWVAGPAGQDDEAAAAGVALLLAAGASVNAPAANGSTALHWAAGAGAVPAVEALLAAGADPRAVTHTWRRHAYGFASGQTPMHWAAESNHTRIVRMLAAHAADAVVLGDERGRTPRAVADAALAVGAADEAASALAGLEATPYVAVRLELESSAHGFIAGR
jgi:hypothetical protein